MKRIFITLIIALIIFNIKVTAQIINSETILEDLVEDIISNSDEEVDFTIIYDDLQNYLENPLSLNDADYEEFAKLHFLNEIQISEIIDYRWKYGHFKTKYELQLLNSFSRSDIDKLLLFITIVPTPSSQYRFKFSNALKYGQHKIYIRTQSIIQPMKGYNISDSVLAENPDKSRYLGNPYKYYFKYKYHYKDILKWGITAEKDAGEQFFTGAQKYGFDFYSAHLQIDNKKGDFKHRIVLGDFQAQYGQGLALWSGFSFGKSAYVLKIKKKPRGLSKYSSTDENMFFRGGGAMITYKNISLSAFGSYHKIDANSPDFDSIDNSEIREISSILNTGYHRTPLENEKRKTIGQTVFGGNILYNHRLFKTGLTFVNYVFSADLVQDIAPYQIYDFQGSSNYNLAWNYEFNLKEFRFFGETGMSKNGALATINGMSVQLEHRVTMVALYRNYSEKYQAFYAGAFGESSSINNEKGIYFGIEIYPYKNFKLSSYIDSYTFPWMSYRLDSPISNGLEYFTQLDYYPSRNFSSYIRFKHEIKPQNTSSEVILRYPVDVEKWNLRFHFNFKLSNNITLKSRLEFSEYQKDNIVESGFMAYQDINFSLNNLPLKFSVRYAIFDAPYNARMYAYENDILYAFSVPAYFYKGFRTYFNVRYKISDNIIIWARYSQFSYSDRNQISETSLNAIDGNSKSEFKLQLSYKF